jgi:dTDP-glucose 4,6-dehydratase
MRRLIAGGAGFIGSALIRYIDRHTCYDVLNVDKLAYAGDLSTVSDVSTSPKYRHVEVDICDQKLISQAGAQFNPDAIVHLAAESHVDRSVDTPVRFVKSNVDGTYVMLEVARFYWNSLSPERRASFRFLHVSTDEVFRALG